MAMHRTVAHAAGIPPAFIVGDNNGGRPYRCPPLIKTPSLSLSLSFSFFTSFSLVSPPLEMFEFFLFTPEDRRPVPRALAVASTLSSILSFTVLSFIGTPECLHCKNSIVTGWLGDPYVGFMNFICTDKTTRIYSCRTRQQSNFYRRRRGCIFFPSCFLQRNRVLRYAGWNHIAIPEGDN